MAISSVEITSRLDQREPIGLAVAIIVVGAGMFQLMPCLSKGNLPSSRILNKRPCSSSGKAVISSIAHIALLASGITPNFKLTVSFSLSAMAVIVLEWHRGR